MKLAQLGNVPCWSFVSWMWLNFTVTSCCLSVQFGIQKTTDWIKEPNYTLSNFIRISLPVLFGTLLLGTMFFLLSLSVYRNETPDILVVSRKRRHLINCNVAGVCFIYATLLVWILLSILLFVPVLFYIILNVIVKSELKCIDLQYYGLWSKKVCETDLDFFHEQSHAVMAAFIAGFCSAILMHFLTITSFNLAKLRALHDATTQYEPKEVFTTASTKM